MHRCLFSYMNHSYVDNTENLNSFLIFVSIPINRSILLARLLLKSDIFESLEKLIEELDKPNWLHSVMNFSEQWMLNYF